MWIDSHCHLNFPDFEGKHAQVFERAKRAGVHHCLTICTRVAEISEIIHISEEHSIHCSVGIHPEAAGSIQHSPRELADWLVERSTHPRVVGLGETGLDATYPNGLDIQKKFLRSHIDAANQTRLPLIIHSRGAENELLNELAAIRNSVPGVIHCFTGTESFAKAVLDRGFYISISGIVTFKNASDLREVVKKIPLNRLLVETDSPYLAPVPHRGKPNEPAYVTHTGEFLAELLGLSVSTVADATTDNFMKLFSKINHPSMD